MTDISAKRDSLAGWEAGVAVAATSSAAASPYATSYHPQLTAQPHLASPYSFPQSPLAYGHPQPQGKCL